MNELKTPGGFAIVFGNPIHSHVLCQIDMDRLLVQNKSEKLIF